MSYYLLFSFLALGDFEYKMHHSGKVARITWNFWSQLDCLGNREETWKKISTSNQ